MPAAVAAYYRVFSGFAEWDDEGILMMQVRQYLTDLTGYRLYEKIYSGYGRVYFFYNWLVRSATVSVTAGRMHRGIPADPGASAIGRRRAAAPRCTSAPRTDEPAAPDRGVTATAI